MSDDGSHCIGCFRSVPEIKAWSQADRAQRLAIWAKLSQRADVPFPPEVVTLTETAQQAWAAR